MCIGLDVFPFFLELACLFYRCTFTELSTNGDRLPKTFLFFNLNYFFDTANCMFFFSLVWLIVATIYLFYDIDLGCGVR